MGLSFAISAHTHGVQNHHFEHLSHGHMGQFLGHRGLMALSGGLAGMGIAGGMATEGSIQQLFMKLAEFMGGGQHQQPQAALNQQEAKGMNESVAQFNGAKSPEEKEHAVNRMKKHMTNNPGIKDKMEDALGDPDVKMKLDAQLEDEGHKMQNPESEMSLGKTPTSREQIFAAASDARMAPAERATRSASL